jgi:hypothetical protein
MACGKLAHIYLISLPGNHAPRFFMTRSILKRARSTPTLRVLPEAGEAYFAADGPAPDKRWVSLFGGGRAVKLSACICGNAMDNSYP